MVKNKNSDDPAEFIQPLNMNGLQGRMLLMPSRKKRGREILMIYGHHSSLERWFGLAQVMNRYGTVTMPDLPGFGGMDSFYKIDQKPTIDNLADYLAAFIKLRYKRRRITIVGMSLGFAVATRMLQRFPDLAKRVDLLVSIVGFAHHSEFTFSKPRYWFYRSIGAVLSFRLGAWFFHNLILQPIILRTFYGKTHNAKRKFADLSGDQMRAMMDVEVWLWRNNDARTHGYTGKQMLVVDNCHKTVPLPVWHVGAKNDHFFDNYMVEQHMQVIFSDFHLITVDLTKHAPTVIASAKEAAPFIPTKLRKVLAKY